MKQAPDFGKMAQNFGDADDREVLRIYDYVTSGGAHLVTANPEEFDLWIIPTQGFHQLRAIHLARSFTRRDQNAHASIVMAPTLLDLNRSILKSWPFPGKRTNASPVTS